MNKRISLLKSALVIVALVCLLLPPALLMERKATGAAATKSRMIAQMLSELPPDLQMCSVLPMIDIEEAWAIEDTRTEAEQPLVLAMYERQNRMGLDQESRTFYCTLGTVPAGEGLSWPDLSLFVCGAPGQDIQVVWIDDYTFDDRESAVRDGYSYELLAYSQTEYEYINLVFTGLPLVSVFTEASIGEDYVPSRVSVSAQGFEPVESATLIHTRGGGYYKGIDKYSYRIEFHAPNGKGAEKKSELSLLGMDASSDWLLLSNAQDETAVRNTLAYDLWRQWNPDGDALMMMDSCLVELFINDEYMGLYQLMEPIDEQEEILRAGGNPATDCVARLVMDENVGEKPWIDLMDSILMYAEYRYAPNERAERAFSAMESFVRLNLFADGAMLSDEEFAALAEQCIDIDEYLSYYLFIQACGATDNLSNNLYIYMFRDERGVYHYRHGPWDLDTAFPLPQYRDDGTRVTYFAYGMQLPQRLLELDVGQCREKLHALYEEKRATILSDDTLYAWMEAFQEEINASGAYLRETEKWRGGAQELDLSALYDDLIYHMDTIEWHLENLWPVAPA